MSVHFCPLFLSPAVSTMQYSVRIQHRQQHVSRGRLTVVFLSLCRILLHDSGCRDRSSRQRGLRWRRRDVQSMDSDVVPEHGLSLSIVLLPSL